MLVPELIGRFTDWCSRHRVPATVRLYRGRLQSFARKFADCRRKDLGPLDIDDWLKEADLKQDSTPLAPGTRRSNRVAFKRLQSWAKENKQPKKTIVKKLEMPRGNRRERIPTTAEIRQLLRLGKPAFRLVYLALLRSGARPNEICRATLDDIETTPGGVRMIVLAEHKTARKTGKPRRIPIGKKLERLIDRSVGSRTTGPLFLSPRGRVWQPSNLSRTFKELRRKAGFSDDLFLYCARHHKETTVCRNHGIQAASQVLGHTQLSTTQRYVHLSEQEIADYQDG
jgi:integrase